MAFKRKIHEIRRNRLAELVAEAGSQSAFARIIGREHSYGCRLLSGDRDLGEKLAREIEFHTGRPEWWLDNYHAENQPARQPAVTPSTLVALIAEYARQHGLVKPDGTPNTARVAPALGLSQSTVSNLMTDKYGELKLSTIQRLVDATRVPFVVFPTHGMETHTTGRRLGKGAT